MAQSEPWVGSDVPQRKFVIKEEFETFPTNLFTKLDVLKSSIPTPVEEPPTNTIAEALKETVEALNALENEVKNLRTSAANKEELKNALRAI